MSNEIIQVYGALLNINLAHNHSNTNRCQNIYLDLRIIEITSWKCARTIFIHDLKSIGKRTSEFSDKLQGVNNNRTMHFPRYLFYW